ncbi:MAG: DUF721 domain-containing protein [Lentisphaeria bacterium]|nr:DUF721 domain-containing protein [Lentisphaeria bacterium]
MPIPLSKYKEIAGREQLKKMLNEWYGERDGALQINAHDKPVRNLCELNEEFLKSAFPANMKYSVELSSHWQEIVSAPLAAMLNFSSLDDDGVLFLEVKHSAFLQEELLKSSDLLLGRINEKLGADVCKDVRFVPSGGNSYSKYKKSGK